MPHAKYEIPALERDKFLPPTISPDRHINRNEKIERLGGYLDNKSIFVIESQPGQGKSIFAKMFTDRYYSVTLWYNITKTDRDPIYLCRNLYQLFKDNFERYECEPFIKEIEDGRAEPLKFETYIRNLIKELKRVIKKPVALVFDNTYLLPNIGLTCQTIQAAMTFSGRNFHIVKCTRSKLRFSGSFEKLNKISVNVDNDILKFSEEEFRRLAVLRLDSETNFTRLTKIHNMTEGWATGISKALDFVSSYGFDCLYDNTSFIEYMDEYFRSVSIDIPDRKLKRSLTLLSLLNRIDTDFASEYHGSQEIAELLKDMENLSSFITKSSKGGYQFQRLYSDWMKNLSAESITEEDIKDFYHQAANYRLKNGEISTALMYFQQGDCYDCMENITKLHFCEAATSPDRMELTKILSEIPLEKIKNRPWLSLLYGHILISASPNSTYNIFKNALTKFREAEDENGIILAISGLMHHICFVSGDLKEGKELFGELEKLYKGIGDEVSEAMLMIIDSAYAAGCVFLETDKDAKPYIDKAFSIANSRDNRFYKIYLLSMHIVISNKEWNTSSLTNFCDKIIVSKTEDNYTASQKTFVNMNIFVYLSFSGSFRGTEIISSKIKNDSRLYVEQNQVFKTFLDSWEIDRNIAEGKFEHAKLVAESYNEYEIDNMHEYTGAIISAYKAIVDIYHWEEKSKKLIEKSIKMIEESGANFFFKAFIQYLAGVAYTIAGDYRRASNHLLTAIDMSGNGINNHTYTASHIYISYLYNNIGDKEKASEYAIVGMRLLKKHRTSRIMVAMPEVIINSCLLSRKDETIKEYAEDIAFDRYNISFDKSGDAIPVMQINTLGDMEISFGRHKLDSSEISHNFRLMLAILLSSKGYKASQEVIQNYIWSSSDKEKARRSFDNLVSRFRSLISQNFKGIDPRDYISVKNGILSLQNCKSNADEFISFYKKAILGYSGGSYITAFENIIDADDIFSDRYFPNISGADEIEHKRMEVDNTLIGMIDLMYKLNQKMDNVFDIDKYFSRWIDKLMHETSMVKTAYKYYRGNGKIVKCQKLIERYRDYLKREEYSQEDISELIYTIKS